MTAAFIYAALVGAFCPGPWWAVWLVASPAFVAAGRHIIGNAR